MRADKKRIDWIDFAKGLTIILVIVGHTISGVGRAIIFSFHMPLFFTLSCITYGFSDTKVEFKVGVKRGFVHLIIPAVVMSAVIALLIIFSNPVKYSSVNKILSLLLVRGKALFWSSALSFEFFGEKIAGIGVLWFLVALFVSRTLLDFIQLIIKKEQLIVAIVVLSLTCLGVLLGQSKIYLPFAMDMSLAVLLFDYLGMRLKTTRIEEKASIKFWIFSILWIAMLGVTCFITHSYLEIACRRYVLFPLCHIIAALGVLCISELSVLLCKCKLAYPLKFIGKNSMVLFIIHNLDYNILEHMWNKYQNEYLNALKRVQVDLTVFAVYFCLLYILKLIKTRLGYLCTKSKA